MIFIKEHSSSKHPDQKIDHNMNANLVLSLSMKGFQESCHIILVASIPKWMFLKRSLKVEGKTYCYSLPLSGHAWTCICFQYIKIWYYAIIKYDFSFSPIYQILPECFLLQNWNRKMPAGASGKWHCQALNICIWTTGLEEQVCYYQQTQLAQLSRVF